MARHSPRSSHHTRALLHAGQQRTSSAVKAATACGVVAPINRPNQAS
ncbi:MAG: hypothetical protein KGK06_10665 [Xanthomonadaceae bacterium]|nr:hypothetical protein [Xanthomonadaceae bacterium]MDE2316856.1 hypothetical protein [Xanthomonadaceae bacterium]